jgi:hypothetical protein
MEIQTSPQQLPPPAWIYFGIEKGRVIVKVNLPLRGTLLIIAAIAASTGSPKVAGLIAEMLK